MTFLKIVPRKCVIVVLIQLVKDGFFKSCFTTNAPNATNKWLPSIHPHAFNTDSAHTGIKNVLLTITKKQTYLNRQLYLLLKLHQKTHNIDNELSKCFNSLYRCSTKIRNTNMFSKFKPKKHVCI